MNEDSQLHSMWPSLAHFALSTLPRGRVPEDGVEIMGLVILNSHGEMRFHKPRIGLACRMGGRSSQGVSGFIHSIFLEILMNPPHLPVTRALALTAEGPQFKVSTLALLPNLLCDLGQVALLL